MILFEWLHRKPTTSILIAEESSWKVVPEADPDEAELPLSKRQLSTFDRLWFFDSDHNGTLDKDELAREQEYLRYREANQVIEARASAARRAATLAKYDLNHDGRLYGDELYQSLVDLNRRPRRRVVLPTNPDPHHHGQ